MAKGSSRSNFLQGVYILPLGKWGDYTSRQIKQWITGAGGQMETTLSSNTTHVVVDYKTWKKKPELLEKAIKAVDIGMDIKIVSYDWLGESLSIYSKKHPGRYLWSRLDRPSESNATKKDGDAKGHVGMMAEALQESTDKYVSEREKKRVEKQIEHAKRVREEMEEEQKREKQVKQGKADLARGFSAGAKKARNEIFSGKLHRAPIHGTTPPLMLTSSNREPPHLHRRN